MLSTLFTGVPGRHVWLIVDRPPCLPLVYLVDCLPTTLLSAPVYTRVHPVDSRHTQWVGTTTYLLTGGRVLHGVLIWGRGCVRCAPTMVGRAAARSGEKLRTSRGKTVIFLQFYQRVTDIHSNKITAVQLYMYGVRACPWRWGGEHLL